MFKVVVRNINPHNPYHKYYSIINLKRIPVRPIVYISDEILKPLNMGKKKAPLNC